MLSCVNRSQDTESKVMIFGVRSLHSKHQTQAGDDARKVKGSANSVQPGSRPVGVIEYHENEFL